MGDLGEKKSMEEMDEEFLTELSNFYIHTQDNILLEITRQNGSAISIADLQTKVSPANTTGQGLTSKFMVALEILVAHGFIKYYPNENDQWVKLDKGGYKLFELLTTQEELKIPYTTYIEKKKKRKENQDKLLSESIQTNISIRTSNRATRNILIVTAFITIVNVGITTLNYFHETFKERTDKRIEQRDSTISSRQSLKI